MKQQKKNCKHKQKSGDIFICSTWEGDYVCNKDNKI